jgi:hypothetical protein
MNKIYSESVSHVVDQPKYWMFVRINRFLSPTFKAKVMVRFHAFYKAKLDIQKITTIRHATERHHISHCDAAHRSQSTPPNMATITQLYMRDLPRGNLP